MEENNTTFYIIVIIIACIIIWLLYRNFADTAEKYLLGINVNPNSYFARTKGEYGTPFHSI